MLCNWWMSQNIVLLKLKASFFGRRICSIRESWYPPFCRPFLDSCGPLTRILEHDSGTNQFNDNIKYFLLLLCFNSLTPSLQSVSTLAYPLKSVSILAQTPTSPPKRADVILECSLRPDNIPRQRLFSSLCQNTNNHTKIHQLTNKKFKNI